MCESKKKIAKSLLKYCLFWDTCNHPKLIKCQFIHFPCRAASLSTIIAKHFGDELKLDFFTAR